MDWFACQAANFLLNNPPNSATIELGLGEITFHALRIPNLYLYLSTYLLKLYLSILIYSFYFVVTLILYLIYFTYYSNLLVN